MRATLEVCVDNFQSVRATVEGGGTRVELCSSLLVCTVNAYAHFVICFDAQDGGLTPSVGFLERVKAEYPTLLVFAMIRPRGGDFCYGEEEIDIMKKDIVALKKAGADGFVFGCLTTDGMVDMDANNILLSKFQCLHNNNRCLHLIVSHRVCHPIAVYIPSGFRHVSRCHAVLAEYHCAWLHSNSNQRASEDGLCWIGRDPTIGAVGRWKNNHHARFWCDLCQCSKHLECHQGARVS